jgi:MFS family permease
MKFGGNAIVYGLLAATYPAFQLIGAPLLGRWSDVYGRKKVLLISNAGTSIGWMIFLIALFLPADNAVTYNLPLFGTIVITLPILLLFLARAIDGITGGNVSSQTYQQTRIEVRILGKWLFHLILALLWVQQSQEYLGAQSMEKFCQFWLRWCCHLLLWLFYILCYKSQSPCQIIY